MEKITKNDRIRGKVINRDLYQHLKELSKASFDILIQHLERGEQLPIKILEEISIKTDHSYEFTKRVVPDFPYFLFNHLDEIEQTQEFSKCIAIMMQKEVILKHFPRIDGKQIGGAKFLSSSYISPFLANLSEEMGEFVFDINASGRFEFDISVFDKAYKEFENYFYKDETKILTLAPIQNLDCEIEEIKLGQGLKIRKLIKKELEDLWSAVGHISHVDRDEILQLRFAVETTCVKNKETNTTEPNPSELLDMVVTALRLFKDGLVWPCFIFSKPLSWLPHEGAWGVGGGIHSRGFREKYFLAMEKAKNFELFWEKICTLDLTKHSFLRVALDRFNHAYDKYADEDKLIDYLIAFEALYSEGAGDLRYKIPTRIARLLKEVPKERMELSSFMKIIYNGRSSIVHGDEISEKIIKKIKERLEMSNGDKNEVIRKAVLETENYLRESIKAFLILDREKGDVFEMLDFNEERLTEEKAKLKKSWFLSPR